MRLRFLYFSIFLLIFGYPLPTPWARFAPFWIDFGTILGLTFPRFPPPALNSCRDFARNFARNLQRTFRELSKNLQEMQRTCRELATNLCKELSPKRNLKRPFQFKLLVPYRLMRVSDLGTAHAFGHCSDMSTKILMCVGLPKVVRTYQ